MQSQETPIEKDILPQVHEHRLEEDIPVPDKTAWVALQQRMRICSEEVYAEFRRAGKYDPACYIPIPGMDRLWGQFVISAYPLLLISGEQGCGKGALLCYWTEKPLRSGNSGGEVVQDGERESMAVLLAEAYRAGLHGRDCSRLLDAWLADTLRLDPRAGLADSLRTALSRTGPEARIILAIDAINEFETVPASSGFNRRRLLEKCVELAGRSDQGSAGVSQTNWSAGCFFEIDGRGLPDRSGLPVRFPV